MLSSAWTLGGAEELPSSVAAGLVSTLSAYTEVSRVAPADAASARKVDVVSCLFPVAHPRQQCPQSWLRQFLQAGAGMLHKVDSQRGSGTRTAVRRETAGHRREDWPSRKD